VNKQIRKTPFLKRKKLYEVKFNSHSIKTHILIFFNYDDSSAYFPLHLHNNSRAFITYSEVCASEVFCLIILHFT